MAALFRMAETPCSKDNGTSSVGIIQDWTVKQYHPSGGDSLQYGQQVLVASNNTFIFLPTTGLYKNFTISTQSADLKQLGWSDKSLFCILLLLFKPNQSFDFKSLKVFRV